MGGTAGADLGNQLTTLSQVGVIGNVSDGQLLQRFLTDRNGSSEAAFSALVQRHGPMVLRVCRLVLGHRHDTEDAFQATFLILARKAHSVRDADSVASWLHGVARRVSVRAKAKFVSREFHERRASSMTPARSDRGESPPESWPELHEEIARLPQHYREAVVLCYLEGLTAETASERLGCSRGTILSRLSRARDQLRARLTRRGLAPAAVLVGAGALPETTEAAVRTALVVATTQAVTRFLAGKTAAGPVPTAFTLAEGMLQTMFLNQMKHVVGCVVAIGVFSIGVIVLAARTSGGTTPAAIEVERPRAAAQPLPDKPPATKTLIDGLLARATAVTSGRIEYHVKIVIAGRTTNDNDERYSFSGESWTKRDPKSNRTVVNHEGRLLAYSETPQQNGSISRSLRIHFPESPFHHEPYPPVHAGTLWYASTRGFVRDQASRARLLGAETVSGITTQILEWTVTESDRFLAFHAIDEMLREGGKLRLYVAPQLAYALPRIEHVDRFGTVQARFDFSGFKELAPGIFFPTLCQLGSGAFHRTYQLKKVERINALFPDKEFVLEIPADTSIGDERPKVTDKLGPDGTRTYSLKDYPFRHFRSGASYPQGLPAELWKEIDRDVARPK